MVYKRESTEEDIPLKFSIMNVEQAIFSQTNYTSGQKMFLEIKRDML